MSFRAISVRARCTCTSCVITHLLFSLCSGLRCSDDLFHKSFLIAGLNCSMNWRRASKFGPLTGLCQSQRNQSPRECAGLWEEKLISLRATVIWWITLPKVLSISLRSATQIYELDLMADIPISAEVHMRSISQKISTFTLWSGTKTVSNGL